MAVGLEPQTPGRHYTWDYTSTIFVDSLQPTLRWEAFPRPEDREADREGLLSRISDVTYDLKIWKAPAGDPGMRLLQRFLWLSAARGMSNKIAFLTDGRFSGTNMGCAVAHISPESVVGGPLALVEDGDTVSIDVENARLDLLVDEVEMKRRHQTWESPEPRIKKGYLSIYSRNVDKTSRGASLKYG